MLPGRALVDEVGVPVLQVIGQVPALVTLVGDLLGVDQSSPYLGGLALGGTGHLLRRPPVGTAAPLTLDPLGIHESEVPDLTLLAEARHLAYSPSLRSTVMCSPSSSASRSSSFNVNPPLRFINRLIV